MIVNNTDMVMTEAATSTELEAPFVNGWFQFRIPSDGSRVEVKKIVRHSGGGKAITVQDFLKKLKKEKVVYGIDKQLIEQLVKQIADDEIPEDLPAIAVADVKHGEAGSIEWCIEGVTDQTSKIYVLPGMSIAIRKLATKGTPGKNVFGKQKSPRPGIDQQLNMAEGIHLIRDKDDQVTYQSSYAGVLKYDSYTISVDPGITVSKDKLQVHMNIAVGSYAESDRTITFDDILTTLDTAGIKLGINKDNINAALGDLGNPDDTVENVLVAEGKASINGEDAIIEWQLDVDAEDASQRAVLPNQLIAIRTPPTGSKNGFNVYGEELPAEDGAMNELECGTGMEKIDVDEHSEYRSLWLGKVEYESPRLTVKSGMDISEDNMEVSMDLYLSSAGNEGGEVSWQHIHITLVASGIMHGIQDKKISSALEEAKANHQSHINLLLAQGRPPRHGVNAELKIDQQLSTGKLLPNGKIDYHEKSYPWNVKNNDVIGRVIPAQAAEDGMNVKGELIPARPVDKFNLNLEGVKLGPDNKLRATQGGVLLIDGLTIKVTDSLVIKGDVCQETGNIHSGSTVLVNGFIEPGFIVEAEGDVIVQDNVEDANVKSSGSVVVKSGIRGSHSEIVSGASIKASFVENAKLIAAGNIHINGSIISCDIDCQDMVYVGSAGSKNSTIVGGIVRALKGVEAAMIGSEGCKKTIVEAGVGPEGIQRFKELKEELKTKKSSLEDLERIHQHYQEHPPKQQSYVDKVIETREVYKKEYDENLNKYDSLQAQIEESKNAKVVILKHVYPGVRIHILDKIYEVKDTLNAGTFSLDMNKIVFKAV